MPITPGSPGSGSGAGGPRTARKTGSAISPLTTAALQRRATAKQLNAKQTEKVAKGVRKGFKP